MRPCWPRASSTPEGWFAAPSSELFGISPNNSGLERGCSQSVVASPRRGDSQARADDEPTAERLGGQGDDSEPVAPEGLDDVEEAVEGVGLGDVAVGAQVVGAADVVGDLGVGEDDDGHAADPLVARGSDGGEDVVALDAGEVEVEEDEVPVEQAAVVEGVKGSLSVGEDLERGG